jgi:hypothetical protein
MKNPGLYLGLTILSDGENGKQVANFTGLSYPEAMEDAEVALTENILANEFGEEFFALMQKVGVRMSELGIAVAEEKAGGADTGAAIKKAAIG